MYLLDPEAGLEEKVLGLRNQLQKKKKKKETSSRKNATLSRKSDAGGNYYMYIIVEISLSFPEST